jgi:hypothetical protein
VALADAARSIEAVENDTPGCRHVAQATISPTMSRISPTELEPPVMALVPMPPMMISVSISFGEMWPAFRFGMIRTRTTRAR